MEKRATISPPTASHALFHSSTGHSKTFLLSVFSVCSTLVLARVQTRSHFLRVRRR
jgi:hypothetical protein